MKYQVYPLEELISRDFDDEEIDVVSKNLQISLISAMFNKIGINHSVKEILKICKNSNWNNNYHWTRKQYHDFHTSLCKVLYNLYRFGNLKCERTSDDWLLFYGFTVK